MCCVVMIIRVSITVSTIVATIIITFVYCLGAPGRVCEKETLLRVRKEYPINTSPGLNEFPIINNPPNKRNTSNSYVGSNSPPLIGEGLSMGGVINQRGDHC